MRVLRAPFQHHTPRRLGIGAVAVVGAVAGVIVLGPTSSDPNLRAASTESRDTPDLQLAQAESEPSEELVPMVTYEIYLDRDPFDPVVPEDTAEVLDPDASSSEASDPDDPDAPQSDPSDLYPSDPTAPDPGDPDAPTTDPGDPADDPDRCVGDEEVVCNGQVISLLELTTDQGQPVAVVQVDTAIYEVREGEAFAERYRMLSIGEREVTALLGDERFSLPVGEAVMK